MGMWRECSLVSYRLNARWAVIAWTAFEGNVPLVALATHPVCPVPNAVGFARQAINVPGGVKGGLSSHAQLEDLVHQVVSTYHCSSKM